MHILVVSNFYPPEFMGGYELGCATVVNALANRGHTVVVLTSATDKCPNIQEELSSTVPVYRKLWFHNRKTSHRYKGLAWSKSVLHSMLIYQRIMNIVHPDICYVWNLGGMNGSPAWLSLFLGIPVCYFVSDHEMAQRTAEEIQRIHWLSQQLQRVNTNIRFASYVQYASHYLAQLSCQILPSASQYSVRHWGVSKDHFTMQARQFPDVRTRPLRLLFAARIVAEKGVDIALQMTENLILSGLPTTLTVAGYAAKSSYVEELHTYVSRHGLEPHVNFLGQVEHHKIKNLMNEHDIFLAPFRWAEPFSISIIEAMATGLPVVATATGGTTEIIENRRNGLIFPLNNPAEGCELIRELCASEELWKSLRQNAETCIQANFRLDYMVDKLEQDLVRLIHHN